MADTSIVSRAELEAIASASGFAIWELEQQVSDSNFRFLRDELRAGHLGPIFSPGQALPPPSPIGQLVQSGVEGVETITDALSEGAESISDTLSKGVGFVTSTLREAQAKIIVVVVALAIIVLVFRFGGRR